MREGTVGNQFFGRRPRRHKGRRFLSTEDRTLNAGYAISRTHSEPWASLRVTDES